MAKFCPECGNELKEDEKFCTKCGHNIYKDENKTNSKTNEHKSILNITPHNSKIIAYILSIVSLIITALMGLSMPLLVFENAILLIICGVLGGIGIIISIKKNEYLIGAITGFITLIMCFISAYLLSLIPCFLFFITAIFCLIGGELKIKDKKLWIIPVIILIIPLLIIGISAAGTGNGDDINITNVANNITYSYGYYDGYVSFDLSTDKSYDYLEASLTYFDENGKVINKDSLAWNELDLKPGTYKVDSWYMEQEMPQKATLEIFDSSLEDKDPIYTSNITF